VRFVTARRDLPEKQQAELDAWVAEQKLTPPFAFADWQRAMKEISDRTPF